MTELLPKLPSVRFDLSTLQRIGQGADGYVWRVFDRGLDKDIAVKTLKFDGELTPKEFSKFVWEHTLASAVVNPHVVEIHDSAPTPERGQDGFIAMELVGNRTLAHQIDVLGALPLDRAAAAGAAIADALAETHDCGILHRDVKPGNVLVGPRGEVKVTDFGNAVLEFGDERRRSLAGTPGYMPPETAREFVAKRLGLPSLGGFADTRQGDVYSLGVVLHELITGQHAFDGPDSEGRLFAQASEGVPPITGMVDGIPPRLANLVTALTEDFPGNRPGSAEEIRDELRHLAETLPPTRIGRPGAVSEPPARHAPAPSPARQPGVEVPVAASVPSRSAERGSEAPVSPTGASTAAGAGLGPLTSRRPAGTEAEASASRSGRGVASSRRLPEARPSAQARGSAMPLSGENHSAGHDSLGKSQDRSW